ncbi:hypothetical protein EJB05_49229, partial [Eragrostis curvula]
MEGSSTASMSSSILPRARAMEGSSSPFPLQALPWRGLALPPPAAPALAFVCSLCLLLHREQCGGPLCLLLPLSLLSSHMRVPYRLLCLAAAKLVSRWRDKRHAGDLNGNGAEKRCLTGDGARRGRVRGGAGGIRAAARGLLGGETAFLALQCLAHASAAAVVAADPVSPSAREMQRLSSAVERMVLECLGLPENVAASPHDAVNHTVRLSHYAARREDATAACPWRPLRPLPHDRATSRAWRCRIGTAGGSPCPKRRAIIAGELLTVRS